jgi:hypothetical protein
MLDWLAQQSTGHVIALLAVGGGLLIPLTALIAGCWARIRVAEARARQAEAEAGLKQDMINRGMSVDEIERVLAAGQGKAKRSRFEHADAS